MFLFSVFFLQFRFVNSLSAVLDPTVAVDPGPYAAAGAETNRSAPLQHRYEPSDTPMTVYTNSFIGGGFWGDVWQIAHSKKIAQRGLIFLGLGQPGSCLFRLLQAKPLSTPPGVDPVGPGETAGCFVNLVTSDFEGPVNPPPHPCGESGVGEQRVTPRGQQETPSRLETLCSLPSGPMRDFIAGVQKAVREALEPLERAQATAQNWLENKTSKNIAHIFNCKNFEYLILQLNVGHDWKIDSKSLK